MFVCLLQVWQARGAGGQPTTLAAPRTPRTSPPPVSPAVVAADVAFDTLAAPR